MSVIENRFNEEEKKLLLKKRNKDTARSAAVTAALVAAVIGKKYVKDQNERKRDILRRYLPSNEESEKAVKKLNRMHSYKKKKEYLNEILPWDLSVSVTNVLDKLSNRHAY